MIGIIVADPNEINKFEHELIETLKVQQFEVNKYKINNNDVFVIFSGIGIANSAAATQALISLGVKRVINYGAVGAIQNEDIEVYDLITPERIYYHDVVTPWYKRGQTPGEKEFYTNDLKDSKLKKYNLASGSSFVTDAKAMEQISKELNCFLFDMECAAIAQICNKNKVELHVIKCVSDVVGQNNEAVEDINSRIAKAGKKAFEYTISII